MPVTQSQQQKIAICPEDVQQGPIKAKMLSAVNHKAQALTVWPTSSD